MRKFFAVILACLLLIPLASATTDNQIDPKDMEQVILDLLTEPMLDAIEQYYGQPHLFWEDSGKLLSIHQAPDALAYEVVTQIENLYRPA